MNKIEKEKHLFQKTISCWYFWPRFYIVVLEMLFWDHIYFFHILFRLLHISFFFSEFYFAFVFGILFPFSIWTLIFLFYLNFCFPFLFGCLSFSNRNFISRSFFVLQFPSILLISTLLFHFFISPFFSFFATSFLNFQQLNL